MTILELIKRTAIMLNIKAVLDDDGFENITDSTQDDVFATNPTLVKLFEFAKLVVGEVLEYAPNVGEQVCETIDKKIMLSNIGNVVKVRSVKTLDGKAVRYKEKNKILTLDEDGTFVVKFHSLPDPGYIIETIYPNKAVVSDDVFVYGLNAYYCLSVGMLPEFNVYHNQYIDKLSKIKNLKLFAMPARRWHE